MTKMPERAELLVRVPRDIKTWLEQQAAENLSSQNSEIVRALRRAKAQSEQRA
jgi:hypothetical protein